MLPTISTWEKMRKLLKPPAESDLFDITREHGPE